MSVRFRFIHLSDPHLAIEPMRKNAQALAKRKPFLQLDTFRRLMPSRLNELRHPSTFIPEIINATARFCLDNASAVDGVILTGDLSTTGMMADLDAAGRYVAPAASGKYLSAGGDISIRPEGVPFYALPGNHDRYKDNIGTSSSNNYDIKFGGLKTKNFKNGVDHWVIEKDGIYIAFVSGDFCLRNDDDTVDSFIDRVIERAGAHFEKPLIGKFSRYGQGRVYPDVLEEMIERTLYIRRNYENCVMAWAIHFAPFDCGGELQLVDWRLYIDAAQRLKINFTLCGHTHKQSFMRYTNHSVYCSGSCGCTDSENDFRVHVMNIDVEDSVNIIRENYLWNHRDGEFVLDTID